jgi:hypothetical protein
MNTSKKLIIVGGAAIILLNPLSVNIIGDLLTTGITQAVKWLVVSSTYTMAVAGTLVFVGMLLAYEASKAKQTKKLKSLKTKKTQSAGEYLDI